MRFALILALVVTASCGKKEPARVNPATATPVAVKTATASRSEVSAGYEVSGTVRARVSATVAARLMGYAREVRGQVGDSVAAGQTLVVLDTRDQDAALGQAEAAQAEAKGAIPEADSAIAAAQANVDLAKTTLQRIQDLFAKRSVTKQELDEAAMRHKSAAAALEMARARRARLDSAVERARQSVSAAVAQKSHTVVAAPFAGVILSRSVEPGTLVVPGAPLFTIERNAGFRLEANVEESRLAGLRSGQAVEVRIEERTIAGRIGEIVPAIDPASRTGIVKIDLPATPGLRSGQFGRAVFGGGSRQSLTVPADAVTERGQLPSVFIVDGKSTRQQLVTLGISFQGRIEILSGLSGGEVLIAPVPPGLSDGAAIEVRQ